MTAWWAQLAIAATILLLVMCIHVRSAPMCVDAQTREQIRALINEGLEQGFKHHVEHLFDVWVKDGSAESQRAMRGMRNVITAYVHARAQTAKWQPPPPCS